MNKNLESYARNYLKSKLPTLPADWQKKFRLMYGRGLDDHDIGEVVDRMPADKLDWAMTQVDNSLELLKK